MNGDNVRSFFRGGGLICSSQLPQQISNYNESITDYDIIRQFFLDLDTQCSKLNALSKQIQSLKAQANILKIISHIQYHSQFINQASRNHGKIKKYVKQTLNNLETLLDCVCNTILSQRFISLQVLIICNQISRLIFQYYAQDQSIPLNQERQQSILTIIKQLEEMLSQGGDQLILSHQFGRKQGNIIKYYKWDTSLNKLWSDIKSTPPLVPIFIQLPTLKEPKFNAVEETLLSYIDLIKNRLINQRTLLYKNKLSQFSLWTVMMNCLNNIKEQIQYRLIKFICGNHKTSNKFKNFHNNYRAWFWENDASGFQSLKEIRLLPFDHKDKMIAINQDRNQILLDTQNTYDQFHPYINQKTKQENQSFLLDQKSSQMLIKIIKETQNVTLFNSEQETAFSKLILCLWHQNLYNNSIQSMDLNQLLETPYMLNIVVEVLPQMNNQASQPNSIKQNFIQNYIDLTKRFLESTIKVFDLNQNQIEQQPEVVQSFRQYLNIEEQLVLDSQNLWDTLIEHQFFNNWNIQSSFEETVSQLQKIQNLINREFFPLKDCNEDLMINLYKSLKSHKLTLFDFFDNFFLQYVENQRQKLIYSLDIIDQNQFEQDIFKYATRLSILMFQRQETIIEIKPQGILFREENSNPYNQFFEDADQYGNYRKQIRKCIPLNQKGNFYQFRHKAIQEFLFSKECLKFFEKAYQVINQLNELLIQLRKSNIKLNLQLIKQQNQLNIQDQSQDEQRKSALLIELLQSIESQFLKQINLQETFNLGALKFIKAKFSQAPDFQKVLYPLILLSSVNKSYTRLSSNCLLICLEITGFQRDKDFSKIIISDISLDGAIFEGCDLRFTQFDKVSIKGLNLNSSDISECERTNIYSNDLPSIQTHESCCYSQLSPNGQLILTYSKEGLHNQYSLTHKRQNIFIWDSWNGNQLEQLKGHTGIEFVCFSHNGLVLLSYGLQSLILWDVQTFINHQILNNTQIQEYKYKSNLLMVSYFQRKTIKSHTSVIMISTLLKMQYQNLQENVSLLKFINNFYQAQLGIKIKCNCITSLYFLLLKNFSQFYFVTFLIIFIYQYYQQQWHSKTGEMIRQQIQKIPEQPGVYYRNTYPQLGYYHMDLLFILYNCNIEKWDIDKFQPNGRPFVGHTYEITCMDVSSGGKYLVSGGVDLLVIIYDVKSCNKISALVGHNSRVTSVQFSPNVKQLISCSEDGLIKFWDAKINYQIENSVKIQSLQFTPDCKQILYSNDRGEIVIIDSETGQYINQLSYGKNIYSMCLHPNGKFLLFTTGSQTKIIDLRLMKQVGETFKTKNTIFRVGYSFDGSKIFLQDDNCIFICNSQNWNIFYKKEYSRFSSISLNYEYIIIGMILAKSIISALYNQILKLNNYLQIRTLLKTMIQEIIKYLWEIILTIFLFGTEIYRKQTQNIAIKISPECNYLLVGDQNGNIYTIDPQKEYQINLIASFNSPIKQIIISPDQRYAITNYPILYISLMGEKDNQIYSQIKYSIPQKLNQQTLTQELKFENSSITSHLGYDLKKIFQKVQ
ncbi:hypothetical protein pb186bvf_018524 [Paramecium bursaria]